MCEGSADKLGLIKLFLAVKNIATIRIIDMHMNKGKTISQCLRMRTDYAKDAKKTDNGKLISSYMCCPEMIEEEFINAKNRYRSKTGRTQINDVIAYQIRQSFRPGEVEPDVANQIGYELAEKYLEGKYAFIVCTHIDKAHIHNHIIWNSTALDCEHKFRNVKRSAKDVMRLSDEICMKYGLSVVERKEVFKSKTGYEEWLGDNINLSQRDLLRKAIDEVLKQKPSSFDAFLNLLEEMGWEVKRGAHIALKRNEELRYKRLDSLGEAYCEESLKRVIDGISIHKKNKATVRSVKIQTVVTYKKRKHENCSISDFDHQNQVVKEIKKTAEALNIYIESGFDSLAELREFSKSATERRIEILARCNEIDVQIKEKMQLIVHRQAYAKHNQVYKTYKRVKNKEAYFAEHSEEIGLCIAAKNAFDQFDGEVIPSVKTLESEIKMKEDEKSELIKEHNRLLAVEQHYQAVEEQLLMAKGVDEADRKNDLTR